ncbi:MAG: ABC transporter substrate-binding protein [Rhodospirillaceae bacterium]
MISTKPSFIIIFLLTLILSATGTSWASDNATGFIKEVGQKAILSLKQTNGSSGAREARFREIFSKSFNVKLLARFSLGVHWRRSTKSQRDEYVKLFEDFVIKAYATRFSDYTGETFNVGDSRDLEGGDKLVASEVVLSDGRRIPVHWRVRNDGGYQIIDVLVEGISMALTQRNEFASIISQNGGKVDGLLIALRKKIK